MSLIRFAMNEKVELGIRQSAAICLKNGILSEWSNSSDKQSKDFIRQNIVQTILIAPKILKMQFTVILNKIITVDYPEKLPQFDNQIGSQLFSNDAHLINNSLTCLLELASVYSTRVAKDSKPFYNLFNKIQARLLELLEVSLSAKVINAETGEIVKMITEFLKNTIKTNLPLSFRKSENITQWIKAMFNLYSFNIPLNVVVYFFFFSFFYFFFLFFFFFLLNNNLY